MPGIRLRPLLLAGVLLATQMLLFALPVAAAEIASGGPLTRVIVTPDLNCQVAHIEDQSFEFYAPSDEIGSCGTFLVVGGALYGPAVVSSGAFSLVLTPWTSAGQSAVAGSGSAGDPLRIVTTVDAGGTGLRIQQTDSYVLGTQSFRTDIAVTNSGPVAQTGVLYRAGDCYLQESDVGFGRVDDRGPACVASTASSSRIEQWTPLTPGSRYMEADYVSVFQAINGEQFPNTCTCDFALDNGAGLSWPVNVAPGQTVTYSHETYFSPRGRAPISQSFSSSVPDPTQITLDPLVVAQTALISAGVILLVPFPSALFNSTLEENYDEVMAAVGRIQRWLSARWHALLAWVAAEIARRRAAAPSGQGTEVVPPSPSPDEGHALGGPLPPALAGPELTPRASAMVEASVPGEPAPAPVPAAQAERDVWRTPLGILGFVLLSAFFYAFLDPTFGLSLSSLASLLGLALGLVIILLAYGLPLVFFSRSHSVGLTVRALPATLIVAIACVVVSRLSDFQPGYLYGLVVGFFFATAVSRETEGKAEAAAAGVSLGAALVAWITLAFLRGGLGPGGELLATFLQAATVTVVVAGLENAVFAMLPLRFMPGEAVYNWNRRVWIVLLGLGVVGFTHVLLNPSSGAGYLSDSTRTSFVTMVVLLVAFGLASVLFWAWFRFRPSSAPHEGGPAL